MSQQQVILDREPIEDVHTEECCACHRTFVFDAYRNLWFLEEDYEIYGFRWLAYDAAVPALKTQKGWCCSAECWDDHREDEIHLVRTA